MPIRILDEHGELTRVGPPAAERRPPAEPVSMLRPIWSAVRQVIFAHAPRTPGVALGPGPRRATTLVVEPGRRATCTWRIVNEQRAAVAIRPALEPASATAGITWRPRHQFAVDRPVLLPGATAIVELEIDAPESIDRELFLSRVRWIGLETSCDLVLDAREAGTRD